MGRKRTVSTEEIFRVASKMIMNNGYSATSLRDIASECGISLGSLCGLYKKKDQLLADLHCASFEGVVSLCEEEHFAFSSPLEQFISTHYCYLIWTLYEPRVLDLYLECTEIPEMRSLYAEKTTELLSRYFTDAGVTFNKWQTHLSSVALSGIQFEMALLYSRQPYSTDFHSLMKRSYSAQLFLMDHPVEEIDSVVSSAFAKSEALFTAIRGKIDARIFWLH